MNHVALVGMGGGGEGEGEGMTVVVVVVDVVVCGAPRSRVDRPSIARARARTSRRGSIAARDRRVVDRAIASIDDRARGSRAHRTRSVADIGIRTTINVV